MLVCWYVCVSVCVCVRCVQFSNSSRVCLFLFCIFTWRCIRGDAVVVDVFIKAQKRLEPDCLFISVHLNKKYVPASLNDLRLFGFCLVREASRRGFHLMKGSGGANSRGKESKEDGRGCRLTQGENHWIYHLSCLLFFYSMIRCSPLTPKNEEMMENKKNWKGIVQLR